MKHGSRWLQLFVGQAYAMKCLVVDDVDVASPIHEDLVQSMSVYLGVGDQGQCSGVLYP